MTMMSPTNDRNILKICWYFSCTWQNHLQNAHGDQQILFVKSVSHYIVFDLPSAVSLTCWYNIILPCFIWVNWRHDAWWFSLPTLNSVSHDHGSMSRPSCNCLLSSRREGHENAEACCILSGNVTKNFL